MFDNGDDCDVGSKKLEAILSTTTTTTTITTTTTTTTTTVLGVNSKCDPRNDACDISKELHCNIEFYECRYITTTVPSKTAPTTVFHNAKPTRTPTNNIGGIVGGVVGVLVVLIVGTFVGRQCSRPTDEVDVEVGVRAEVRARMHRQPRPQQQQQQPEPAAPQHAYGQTTPNPSFNHEHAANQEATYAEIAEEPAYEPVDPNRPSVYDTGGLPGAKDHALRDMQLSQQLDDDEDDFDI